MFPYKTQSKKISQQYKKRCRQYFNRGQLVKLANEKEERTGYAILLNPFLPKTKDDYLKKLSLLVGTGEITNLSLQDISHTTGIVFHHQNKRTKFKKSALKFLKTASNNVNKAKFRSITAIRQELETFQVELQEHYQQRAQKFEEMKKRTITKLEHDLVEYPCHTCPRQPKQSELQTFFKNQQTISRLTSEIRDISLIHAEEFHCKIGVLQNLDYLDQQLQLTAKGVFLMNIFVEQELFLVESLLNGVVQGLDEHEIAACLGLLVSLSLDDSKLVLPELKNPRLLKTIDQLQTWYHQLSELEEEFDVESNDYFYPNFQPGIMQLVYMWSQGLDLTDLAKKTTLPEGNIILLLRRVVDLLYQIEKASTKSSIDMGFNVYDVIHAIRRGHVRVRI